MPAIRGHSPRPPVASIDIGDVLNQNAGNARWRANL